MNIQQGAMQNAHCVSLINAILLHNFSVALGVGGTPETKEKPNLCWWCSISQREEWEI